MEDERVLLTGASSGIGRALALKLAARGARLALTARREERLRGLADEIVRAGGAPPAVLAADLATAGAAAELASHALEELGGVDVLVNNAGGALHGQVWAAGDCDAARELLEVNYWSPLALIHALVPPMRERGSGTVVDVTSMVQVSPFPRLGHYCSSKAALALATQALRLELRGSGVRVIEVALGVVDTPGSFENRELPGAEGWLYSGPVGSAEGAAQRIAAAIESGRERVIYPRRVAVGYAIPGLARGYAARFARRAARAGGDDAVRRTGSLGHEAQRAAREEWERRHATGPR